MRQDGHRPSVSVIVPLFNYARYIEEALESVIRQTFADWEVIVVDDGSTDGGEAVAIAFGRKYPSKVRCLSHPGRANRGLGATRRLAIDHASGKYIAFLDADDVWLPPKLERQVGVLNEHPEVGLTYGIMSCVDEHTRPLTTPTGPYGLQGTFGDGPPAAAFHAYEMLLKGAITTTPSAVMVRLDVLVESGSSPTGLKHLVEDQVMWARISRRASFYFLPEILTLYRVHPRSWSCAQDSLSVIDADLEFLRCLAGDSPSMDRPLVEAFTRFLRRYWKAPGVPLDVRTARMEEILRFLDSRETLSGRVGRFAKRWRRCRRSDRSPSNV